MNLQLTSTAFQEGQPIPRQYTGDGRNLSPPLAWRDPPAGTQSWALICEDPDATKLPVIVVGCPFMTVPRLNAPPVMVPFGDKGVWKTSMYQLPGNAPVAVPANRPSVLVA